MTNPYRSPASTESRPELPEYSSTLAAELVRGVDWSEFCLSDVSDQQLYGKRRRSTLTGPIAAEASALHLSPEIRQAVLWFCLVYLPIWPLGCYAVMAYELVEGEDGHLVDDRDRYRVLPVRFDRGQALRQFVTAWGVTLLVVGVLGLRLLAPS